MVEGTDRTSKKIKTGSRLEWLTLPRSCLEVTRRFGVYLPDGYRDSAADYPVLYLFRGHESEWAGRQDGREGLVSILDRLIASGVITPLIVVLPGFMQPSRKSQGLPIDWSARARDYGLGNGRLERHFFEVKQVVESRFRVRVGKRHAAIDGFSMGGFSTLCLATRYPTAFGSVGAYDGSFMWPGQIDPRRGPRGRGCRLWFSETCAPYFRRDGVWNLAKMERFNPVTWIRNARGSRLMELRDIRFHVRAAGTEEIGNLDRTEFLDEELARQGIRNSFRGDAMRLDSKAEHTWKWADIHLQETLRLHDSVFRTRVTDLP